MSSHLRICIKKVYFGSYSTFPTFEILCDLSVLWKFIVSVVHFGTAVDWNTRE